MLHTHFFALSQYGRHNCLFRSSSLLIITRSSSRVPSVLCNRSWTAAICMVHIDLQKFQVSYVLFFFSSLVHFQDGNRLAPPLPLIKIKKSKTTRKRYTENMYLTKIQDCYLTQGQFLFFLTNFR